MSKDNQTLLHAFLIYILDLCLNPIWSPHFKQDTDSIEKVQRRFTKRVKKFHKYTLFRSFTTPWTPNPIANNTVAFNIMLQNCFGLVHLKFEDFSR